MPGWSYTYCTLLTVDMFLFQSPVVFAFSLVTAAGGRFVSKEEMDQELEGDPNYPVENILEAVASLPAPLAAWLQEESKEQIRKQRQTGDQFQKKLCEVDVSSFRPRAERRTEDADDNNMYNIINLAGVVQRVTTQVCYMSGLNTGSYRMMGTEHWCRQEFVTVPLAAVARGSRQAVIKRFKFPYGCSCYLSH